MATDQKEEVRVGLAFLGDVQLRASPDAPKFTNEEGAGPFLGGGDGTINGPRLKGSVRWDFYEDIGETFCTNSIAGYIDTGDGARINLVTRGHALVPDKTRQPNSCSMTHSVLFTTDDERYQWLNNQLGVWNGEFNFGTYEHNYKAYANIVEDVASVSSDAAFCGPAGSDGPAR